MLLFIVTLFFGLWIIAHFKKYSDVTPKLRNSHLAFLGTLALVHHESIQTALHFVFRFREAILAYYHTDTGIIPAPFFLASSLFGSVFGVVTLWLCSSLIERKNRLPLLEKVFYLGLFLKYLSFIASWTTFKVRHIAGSSEADAIVGDILVILAATVAAGILVMWFQRLYTEKNRALLFDQ